MIIKFKATFYISQSSFVALVRYFPKLFLQKSLKISKVIQDFYKKKVQIYKLAMEIFYLQKAQSIGVIIFKKENIKPLLLFGGTTLAQVIADETILRGAKQVAENIHVNN